ncbi:MAG: plasmid pRiA4b ORF-3 family protein [Rhizobiaceae bacterium]
MELDGAICKTGGMSNADRIARIRIQLDDWQPAIWRRVEVPTATLKALHDVIQAAMLPDDYHLFEFRADGKRYAIPDPEWDSLRDKTYWRRPCGSARWSIAASSLPGLHLRLRRRLAAHDDRGDRRRSRCRVSLSTALAVPHPKMSAAFPASELFLDAIADPKHDSTRFQRWYGRPFDPGYAAEDEIQTRIKKPRQTPRSARPASRKAVT